MASLDLTASSGALPLLLRDVRAGRDVLAIGAGEDGRALLDHAAQALENDCSVLRIAPEAAPLSLSGLIANIAGQPDLAAHDDAVVELGYRRLSVPDTPGQRIVLLISDAGRLQRQALRFIQHVARNAPPLLLVLAGGPELETMLDEPEFASLRNRLPAAGGAPTGAPAPRERPSPVSSDRRRSPLWAIAGFGIAASIAIAAWAVRDQSEPPLPTVAVKVAAVESPAPPQAGPVAQQTVPPPPAIAAETSSAPASPAPVAPIPARRPKQADARAKEPPRPAVRRAQASRPAPARPDPERGHWEEESPQPVYSGPAPPYWATPGYQPWRPPPFTGAYAGSYQAEREALRDFGYEGRWR